MGIKSTNRRLLRPNFYFNFATAPASAWPRESFSGIVCSNLGVSGRSGRNYHADCPVPPRCYGAPPKCGVNQSMAPFFGSHCGTPVHQKMVPPATSTPSAKAAKFAAHVACSQYGRVVNAHHLLPLFRKFCDFSCFTKTKIVVERGYFALRANVTPVQKL